MIAIIGLAFYPLLVILQVKTFSEYLSFVQSVIKLTYEVPWLIIENTYKVGWNLFFFLYLITYAVVMRVFSFMAVYLKWLLSIFNLTIEVLFEMSYYVRMMVGWTVFYLYHWSFIVPQLAVEMAWQVTKNIIWPFFKSVIEGIIRFFIELYWAVC